MFLGHLVSKDLSLKNSSSSPASARPIQKPWGIEVSLSFHDEQVGPSNSDLMKLGPGLSSWEDRTVTHTLDPLETFLLKP